MRPSWTNDARAFVEIYHMDAWMVEDVVRAPTTVELDPHSNEVGYPVRRMRRGDITVVVGFRDPEDPTILFIHLDTPDNHTGSGGSIGGRAGAGLGVPGSVAEMLRALEGLGLQIRYGKHYQVYDGDIFVTHLASTPRDRNSVKAAWRTVNQYLDRRAESEREGQGDQDTAGD